jgi:hypothetical protein
VKTDRAEEEGRKRKREKVYSRDLKSSELRVSDCRALLTACRMGNYCPRLLTEREKVSVS